MASIVILSSYSLLLALVKAAGLGSKALGMDVGKNLTERAESMEETKKVLEEKMLDDIYIDLERIGNGESAEMLRRELEDLQKTLPHKIDMDPAATVSELNALREKIYGVELDEKQSRAREGLIREKIEALRLLGIPSYEKELDRLERELAEVLALPIERRLLELQGILDELEELEVLSVVAADADIGDLKENRYTFEPSVAEGGARGERAERIEKIREIRDWAGRIAELDEYEGEKVRPMLANLTADTPFPDRLKLLARQLRTAWGAVRERAVLTELFRSKLQELTQLVLLSGDAESSPEGVELVRRSKLLCGGKYIERTAFMALYEDIAKFVFARNEAIADAIFAQKVEDSLQEMGYSLLTAETDSSELRANRVHYLESPYEGYRVMLKIGAQGELTTRLVRTVATEEEAGRPSAYQKQKDLEIGKKWCGDLEGFMEKMKEEGLPLDISLIKKPEESDVMVVVDADLPARSDTAKKRSRRAGETFRTRSLGKRR